jgi:hypothetical protein
MKEAITVLAVRGIRCLFTGLLISLTVSGQTSSYDQAQLTVEGKKAYNTLRTVKFFAIGGVGYAGQKSDGERALEVLIEERIAVDAFKSLVAESSLEGALYGLFGLKMLKCECFEAEFSRFRASRFAADSKEMFTTMSGCLRNVAERPQEKNLMLDYVMKDWFGREAKRKECLRQTNGRPQDQAKCYE